VKESGPESKNTPTIIFAHRLLLNGKQWDPQVNELNSYFRCVQMDLNGHGKSEFNPDASWSHLGLGLQVSKVLKDCRANTKVVVVADEISTISAAMVAISHPQIVGLVLVNPVLNGFSLADTQEMEQFYKQWSEIGWTEETKRFLTRYFFGQDSSKLGEPFAEDWSNVSPDHMRLIIGRLAIQQYRNTWKYGTIRQPILLIQGDHAADRDLVLQYAEDFLPSTTEIVKIKGSRTPNVSHASEFNRELTDFLKRLNLGKD